MRRDYATLFQHLRMASAEINQRLRKLMVQVNESNA